MAILPAAVGIIFNSNKDQVLLIKRQDVPVWVLPGGGVEPGESPEEAVKREVFEETGLDVEIERKCAEYTPLNKLAAFTSVYICRIKSGSPTLSNESSGIDFFALSQLPRLFFYVHKDWLNDALSHSTLIQKSLDTVTYWNVFKWLIRHPYCIIRFTITRLTRS